MVSKGHSLATVIQNRARPYTQPLFQGRDVSTSPEFRFAALRSAQHDTVLGGTEGGVRVLPKPF